VFFDVFLIIIANATNGQANMSYTIAIAGKGGTGKTTIAALMVRLIKEKKKGAILAIDADPNSNLAEFLGIKIQQTIGDILDAVASNPASIPTGMTKDRFIDYHIQNAIVESEGFDILTMGHPEGPGCYCYVNNVLRQTISKLARHYDYVIIDNEAGLEHLSRRTTGGADVFMIISEPGAAGLRTAARIKNLIDKLNIPHKKVFLINNRLREQDIDLAEISSLGLQCLGSIPQDREILNLSYAGRPLSALSEKAVSLVALRKIREKIL
jgi:CO dehydrogenase maturation factor